MFKKNNILDHAQISLYLLDILNKIIVWRNVSLPGFDHMM